MGVIYEDGIPAKYNGRQGDAPCIFCGQYNGDYDSERMCFDCWYLIDWGVRAERERIIKLLESKSECNPISGHDWNGDCYCEHIALIKGEK